jgi:hypothetical protein
MATLGEGEADSSRAVVARAKVTPGIDPAALAANFAGSEDLHWLLDDELQRLVLDLPPSAFDKPPELRCVTAARAPGDTALTCAWADTPSGAEEIQAPRGAAAADAGGGAGFLGKGDEAVREASAAWR